MPLSADVPLPDLIRDEKQLDDLLTRPSPELVTFFTSLRGSMLVLGAGGKMGPSLAVLAQRAAAAAESDLRVIAVSRFSDATARDWLTDRGVETLSADLLDRADVAALPEAQHLIYLVGTKFGTSQNPSRTWAINTVTPANVMERYRNSRIVALSTGNVYPLTPVSRGGSLETDALAPVGEYPAAAVGRERIFEHFSGRNGTPVTLIRLNYATDLRYGVLTDIACKVAAEESVDLTNGYLNCIWQRDANDMILRALPFADSPPQPLNLTGTETLSVRELALEFGRLMNKPVRFTGTEAETALLSNSSDICRRLGKPATPIQDVIRWTAAWVNGEGRLLNKPTHFEVRDGAF